MAKKSFNWIKPGVKVIWVDPCRSVPVHLDSYPFL